MESVPGGKAQAGKAGEKMDILVTGADRGLGCGMSKRLLELGHRVFAGKYMWEWKELDELAAEYGGRLIQVPLDVSDTESVLKARKIIQQETTCLDIIISNAAINGKLPSEEPMKTDYEHMMRTYDINSVGAVRIVETFREMMKSSEVKHICFVSSEAGSIAQATREDNFSYCMSKAALNMYAKLIHNRLSKEGYHIRLYHPGWIRSYMGGELSENGHLSIEEAAGLAVNYFTCVEAEDSELHLYGYDGEIFQF